MLADAQRHRQAEMLRLASTLAQTICWSRGLIPIRRRQPDRRFSGQGGVQIGTYRFGLDAGPHWSLPALAIVN